MTGLEPLLALLYGMIGGAMVAIGVALSRAPTRTLRLTGLAFSIAVAAYAVKLWEVDGNMGSDAPSGRLNIPLSILVTAMSVGAMGWLWLFTRALFEDRKPEALHLCLVGGLILSALLGAVLPWDFAAWFWLVFNAGQAGMAIAILIVVVRGRTGDLVEARRRLRAPFLVAAAGYAIMLSTMDALDTMGFVLTWYPIVNAAALALVCVSGAFVFLDARADLFGHARGAGSPEPAPAAPAPDRAARADLDRLDALMTRDEVWRSEGLTIAGLALKMNMPETQLRRLINDQLGHRNFPAFVNARRIREAQRRLADPAEARTPVSAIAFDIGFGSLGPFNRAFREATGKPPTEWRREALGLRDEAKAGG